MRRLALVLLLAALAGGVRPPASDADYSRAFAEGNRLAAEGDVASALAAFERAVVLRPSSFSALQNIGVLALRLGHAVRAEQALELALELTPGRAELLNGLGMALLAQGKHAQAVAAMNASVLSESNPRTKAQWASNLAVALHAAGDTRGARDAEVAARPASQEQAQAWAERLLLLQRAQPAGTSGCPLPSPSAATLRERGSRCERVPASQLTAELFYERHVMASSPVLVEGAFTDSFAPLSAADVAARSGEELLPVSLAFPGGETHAVLPFAHPRVKAALGAAAAAWHARVNGSSAGETAVLRAPQSRMSLSTLLALLRTPGAPPLYAHQLPAETFMPDIVNDGAFAWLGHRPEADSAEGGSLAPPPWASRLRPMASAHAWLTSRAATGLHFDRGDNVLALLAGRKRVLLLPPAAHPQLLRYAPLTDVRVDAAGAGVLVSDNHARWDAFRAEDEALEGAITCDVEAGEALFIPYGWHHAVQTQPSPAPDCWSVALNWWFHPPLARQSPGASGEL